MAQSNQQDIEGNIVDGHLAQLKSASEQSSLPSQNESHFGDSSGKFFSIYSKISEREDKKITDRWQTDVDGMLIFTGLFSAVVASLLSMSVQDLRKDPQEIMTFYLENIYQILADQNRPQGSILTSIPAAKPPPFSPPRSAIWLNSLWFLSLAISLTCASLATSLQQWARRYVRLTQPARCSPEKRARVRAFFAGGVEKMDVLWAVEALPALLHLALFFFFVGIGIFLSNINKSVFVSVIWWIVLYATAYGSITFLPMLRPDSPYYTPLSTPASFLFVYTLKIVIIVVNVALCYCAWLAVTISAAINFCFACAWVIICSCAITRPNSRYRFRDQRESSADSIDTSRTLLILRHGKETWHRCMWIPKRVPSFVRFLWDAILPRSCEVWNIVKVAEQATLKRSSEIDLDILNWTIPVLGDDLEEEFFEAIPGFFNSKLVNVPKISARRHHTELYFELRNALNGFLRRTLSSDSIHKSIKKRRLNIYLDVVDAIYAPYYADGAVTAMIAEGFSQLPQSIEVGYTLARWFTAHNQHIAMAARLGVATILGAIQNRDDLWIALARDQFGLQEQGLQDNIRHGNDSVLLAIFLHMTREVLHIDPWNPGILSSLPKFDIHNTRDELKIELCVLWNEIGLKASHKEHPYIQVLREIRHLYAALLARIPTTPDVIDRPPDFLPMFDIAIDHSNETLTLPTQHNPSNDAPTEGIAFLSEEHHSSPSSTADITATLNPDEWTQSQPMLEMEEISQTPTETLPSSPHSERVTGTLLHPTVSRLPSGPAQYPDIDVNERQDVAMPPVTPSIAQVSLTADQTHLSTASNIGSTLETNRESTSAPPAIDSGTLSLPIITPGLHSSAIPAELSSPVESASIQPSHVSHSIGSPSPSLLPPTNSDLTPLMTSILDTSIGTSTVGLDALERDGTSDASPSIPIDVFLHVQQSEQSTHDIAEDASQR